MKKKKPFTKFEMVIKRFLERIEKSVYESFFKNVIQKKIEKTISK